MNVFRPTYRDLTTLEKQRMEDIKTVAQTLYDLIDSTGPSRECARAKTKLEESVMWAVKGITA